MTHSLGTPPGPMRVLIVESPYDPRITEELRAGAVELLKSKEVGYDILSVPGAFEIPAAIAHMAGLHLPPHGRPAVDYDGYLALGCVIRGETTQYDYLCAEVARGLQHLAVVEGLAIGYGVLTVENEEQALARASRDRRNKGAEAVRALLTMVALKRHTHDNAR